MSGDQDIITDVSFAQGDGIELGGTGLCLYADERLERSDPRQAERCDRAAERRAGKPVGLIL